LIILFLKFARINNEQIEQHNMAQVELIMPKMGESVAEATVINWLKEIGDKVETDEAVVEIATDKVDSEIPSEADGILVKKLFEVDEVVQVGQAIAIIETEGEAENNDLTLDDNLASNAAKATEALISKAKDAISTPSATADSDRFYSPLVKSIAEEEGISTAELDAINGTGKDGRVTKADILSYLKHKSNLVKEAKAAPVAQATTTAQPQAPKTIEAPTVTWSGKDEVIEMDRMRKIIANHMVMSKQVSPHVTSFVEVDVTRLVMWRNKVKNAFLEKNGEKITFTPIFVEAVAKAIKDFPMINISVADDKIIKRGNINIGMATALPSGNLIVPVIKDADSKNLLGLAKDVNGLANKARNNNLSPDDISGGTYTISNVGNFGNITGTPIINQPQVAILAFGVISKVPAVVETPEGDVIAIRQKMILAHAYDHRVVDGALGGMFVKRVAEYLEAFDIDREF
jgi:2-oxoglutarate dehydrogenase E2 component (dihydrolipoamide succinyltransferase)